MQPAQPCDHHCLVLLLQLPAAQSAPDHPLLPAGPDPRLRPHPQPVHPEDPLAAEPAVRPGLHVRVPRQPAGPPGRLDRTPI